MTNRVSELRTVVCIPCYNEEAAIGQVVSDFRAAIPNARIVVIDNGSRDQTAERARAAGAEVLSEPRPGKGRAVTRAFADLDGDCYVMVDGDGTYDAGRVPAMVDLIADGSADMVCCARVESESATVAYRPGHRLGNRVLTSLFQGLFGLLISDALTGYRAMSRRFVKTFPSAATGFEIEAELNIHAALMQVPLLEITGEYRDRAEGTVSKLNTYRDGLRILRRNLRLFRDGRPNLAFSILAAPWFLASTYLVGVAVVDYAKTGQVARLPSLIADVGAFLVALNTSIAGVILERPRSRRETARLQYLAHPGPRESVI